MQELTTVQPYLCLSLFTPSAIDSLLTISLMVLAVLPLIPFPTFESALPLLSLAFTYVNFSVRIIIPTATSQNMSGRLINGYRPQKLQNQANCLSALQKWFSQFLAAHSAELPFLHCYCHCLHHAFCPSAAFPANSAQTNAATNHAAASPVTEPNNNVKYVHQIWL